jgi:hypothetical protein
MRTLWAALMLNLRLMLDPYPQTLGISERERHYLGR